jgi:hypothetical protein
MRPGGIGRIGCGSGTPSELVEDDGYVVRRDPPLVFKDEAACRTPSGKVVTVPTVRPCRTTWCYSDEEALRRFLRVSEMLTWLAGASSAAVEAESM